MMRFELINIRSKLFAMLVSSFIILTLLVVSNLLAEDVTGIERGNPIIDMTMIIFSTSADIFPFYFSPLIIISFILTIKKSTRKAGAILLITIVLVAFLTLQLKDLIDRERPRYEFKPNVGFEYKYEIDSSNPLSGSYPSGHASRSAAFTYILSYLLAKKSKKASILIWIFPIGVSISRVYMGLHYPSDVIGGALLGVIVAIILAKLLRLKE